MSQSISLWGASYTDVPGVLLPKTGGGTALFSDATPTTAQAADVASGKYFLAADGTLTQGTGSGGGGGSTTWSTLYNASTYIYYGTPPYVILSPFDNVFGANETYRITWAGETYLCQTKVDSSGTSYDGYFIGNEHLVGGTIDTEEPFLIYRDNATRALAVTDMPSQQNINVKIEKEVSVSGLVYEQGTYTPSSNVAQPTISFANTHTALPMFVMIADCTNDYSTTTYTNYMWAYLNYYTAFGAIVPYSSSSGRYGQVTYAYRSNGASSTSQGTIQISSTTGTSSTSDLGYWLSTTAFKPGSNSTSRYWRSGRTYKWIAVWK